MDKEVLDFIIYLVKRKKEIDENGKRNLGNLVAWDINNSASYLLSQVIRQLKIPDENKFVSERALIEWNKLTNNSGERELKKVQFRDKIISQGEGEHRIYKGNKMEPEAKAQEIKKSEKFVFNDIFHEEHIIPVSVIVEELLQLNNNSLNYEKVEEIIQKIVLCIMLKSENAKLNKVAKSKRPNNIDDVINKVYLREDVNIKIK